jgi:hypothetical protein
VDRWKTTKVTHTSVNDDFGLTVGVGSVEVDTKLKLEP